MTGTDFHKDTCQDFFMRSYGKDQREEQSACRSYLEAAPTYGKASHSKPIPLAFFF